MKKILLSILAMTVLGVSAQNIVFGDPNLKQKIVLHGQNVVGGVTGTNITVIDTDLNGEISIVEAQAYTGRLYLNQNGSNFYTDLTGVEEFINITELFCQNNQMTTLDVSANTELTLLNCEYNQITTLNLANNVNLTSLNYSYNDLPNVNLSPLVNLTELVCDHSNIINIDLSSNVNLIRLDCFDNSITSLDFTNNINLTDVSAYNNQIATINLLANVNLEDLYLSDNLLTSIDLSNNVNLIYFYISTNSLTALDVSTNINLSELNCSHNEITELVLSSNVNLGELYASNNLISNLVLPNATDGIYVSDNLLTSLDLSGNIDFWGLDCRNNQITILNVANTGNTNVWEILTVGNPNLSCIQVDDVAYSTTNWMDIDATTSFSLNCPVLVNDVTVTSQSAQYVITTDGGDLQMEADVLPLNATDATNTWSVTNGTGAATINASGLLTATNNGTVTVIATANDGSGITGSVDVVISNQTMASINVNNDLVNVTLYPNPTTGVVNFSAANQIESIEIYNLLGEKIETFSNPTSINITDFETGVYMLKINTKNGKSVTKKLIKK